MLMLTISRCDESGHTETLVAINDPPFVRQVLASVSTIAAGEEENNKRARPVSIVRTSDREANRDE